MQRAAQAKVRGGDETSNTAGKEKRTREKEEERNKRRNKSSKYMRRNVAKVYSCRSTGELDKLDFVSPSNYRFIFLNSHQDSAQFCPPLCDVSLYHFLLCLWLYLLLFS